MMIDQVANEVIIAAHLLHTNDVNRIAQELGHRPLLIITGLYKAQELGKIEWDEKKDLIKVSPEVTEKLLFTTEATQELTELLDQFIYHMNTNKERDVSVEELTMLLGGVPELHIKMAAFKSDRLSTYELADPADKKSVYTFLTLNKNLEKQWGKNQFDKENSLATKAAKKNK